MRKHSNEGFIPTNVVIEFEDGPVSFRISQKATLADISENLHKIAKWHRGAPISIDVRFKASDGKGSGDDRAHPLISSPISHLDQTEQHAWQDEATEAASVSPVIN